LPKHVATSERRDASRMLPQVPDTFTDSHGQGRAGQGRAGQGRAGQGRAGQGRAKCNALLHINMGVGEHVHMLSILHV